MHALPVKDDSYSKLLYELKAEIAEGLKRARDAYHMEKILTYWKMGQSIFKYLLVNKDRADYGKQLYNRLSHDLEIGERLLYQISQFYNAYPDFKPAQNLKWSHYRLLTSVKDDEQRSILENKVSEDNWSKRALEEFIKESKEKGTEYPKNKTKKRKNYLFSKAGFIPIDYLKTTLPTMF